MRTLQWPCSHWRRGQQQTKFQIFERSIGRADGQRLEFQLLGSYEMTYRGMTVEEIKINGDKGTPISAYVAKPSGKGPFPGVVLVHHLPGWSEIYCEMTRKFAHHGYIAI